MNMLFRFVRQVVLNVTSQAIQQMDLIQEQAYDSMQAMVQQVMDGLWVGKGADAFVEEVSDLFMPEVRGIGKGIGRFCKNIDNSVSTMDAADEQITGIINSLGDLFSGIC